MNSPCKDCRKRNFKCHTQCEDYIKYDKYNEEQRKKKRILNLQKEYAKAVRRLERNERRKEAKLEKNNLK